MPRTSKKDTAGTARRKDCFAAAENMCQITFMKNCDGCKFFKTYEQLKAEQAKAQAYIEKKYGVPYRAFVLEKGLVK